MKKKAEIILSLMFIAIAGYFYYLSTSLREPAGGDVGGAFYPRILIIGMVLLSINMIVGAIRKNTFDEEGPLFDLKEGGLYRVLIAVGLSVIYFFTLDIGGFLITSTIFLIALMTMMKAGKIWFRIIISLAVVLIVWYVFMVFLRVPLPRGIILG